MSSAQVMQRAHATPARASDEVSALPPPQYQIFDIGVVQMGDTVSQGFGVSPGVRS